MPAAYAAWCCCCMLARALWGSGVWGSEALQMLAYLPSEDTLRFLI